MKILVINWQDWTHPEAGGAETHLYEIFRRLAARGHQITLLCSHYSGAPVSETIDGIAICRYGSRNIFNFLVPFYYLFRLKKERFDVIVDDLNKIPFFTPLFIRRPLVGICHHFFGKTIFHEVGFIRGSYVLASEVLAKIVYRRTRFLAVSKSTIDELVAAGFDRKQFSMAMNAITYDGRYQLGVTRSPHPMIAYVGRLKKYKSVDHLVRAFVEVRKVFPTAELLIVGRGDHEKQLRELVDALGLSGSTRFIGFITEDEKHRLLQQAWVCVNPSIKEGWGIVNIEASACGTPAVAADSPGLRDSIQEGRTGLLYPYGDIDALADMLIRVLGDNNLRATLGEQGIAFARSFSWETSADAMLVALEETVKNHRNTGK